MEQGRRPTIPDQNWRRVSRTLDFILSYPVKEVQPKIAIPEVEPIQKALPLEGVVFEAVKV